MDPIFSTINFALNDLQLAQIIDWDVSRDEKASTILRLMLAMIFGGLLGWERERSDKPADIRTMILISTGAAAFAMLGEQITLQQTNDAIIRVDPTRIVSYIISGVGFLGAGAILHSKRSIKGLTTAASIWVVAAIGAACGVGEFMIAFILFVITFVTLWSPWVLALATNAMDDEDIDSLTP